MPAGLPPRRGGSPLAKRLKINRRNPNGKRCWFGRQKRRPPEKAERIQDDHASAHHADLDPYGHRAPAFIRHLSPGEDSALQPDRCVRDFLPGYRGGDLFHLPVFKDVRPHHGAGSDRGSDRHLHRLHLRLYHHPHKRPLQGLSEDHRHPAHPVPALHSVPVHHLSVRAAGADYQRAAEDHGQRRLRHGQPDRGAGAEFLPHRLYDPLRHPLLHRRIGGGRRLQHGRQPVAHLLDGHLPAVPAGHHLRLPAGVHPVSGGLLQPRHHRRRFHHLICGSLSNHHRQL